MSESGQRRRVVRALRGYDAHAVENPVHPGTPDVECTLGWLELKWVRSWPKRDATPVKIEHFTPQQRIWLKRRWDAGGVAVLLLQVKQEWLLFRGCDVDGIGVEFGRQGLYDRSYRRWKRGLKDYELAAWMIDLGSSQRVKGCSYGAGAPD